MQTGEPAQEKARLGEGALLARRGIVLLAPRDKGLGADKIRVVQVVEAARVAEGRRARFIGLLKRGPVQWCERHTAG